MTSGLYTNILALDKFAHSTGNIRISCTDIQQYGQTAETTAKCGSSIDEQLVGGYASSSSLNYRDSFVVLCPIYFQEDQRLLSEILDLLDDDVPRQHDPLWMAGKGKIFLHE